MAIKSVEAFWKSCTLTYVQITVVGPCLGLQSSGRDLQSCLSFKTSLHCPAFIKKMRPLFLLFLCLAKTINNKLKKKWELTESLLFMLCQKGASFYFWASGLSVPGGTGPVRQWWGRPDNGAQGFVFFECVLWYWREVLFMCLCFRTSSGRWQMSSGRNENDDGGSRRINPTSSICHS